MYVSDEEDKPEMIIISSPVEVFGHHCIDTLEAPQDDLECDAMEELANTYSRKAEKRHWVHFSPAPRLKIKSVRRTSH